MCSARMEQLWTRKREMGDEDENNVEDTIRNQGYNLPDWVKKTSYQCYFMPDRDFSLLNR